MARRTIPPQITEEEEEEEEEENTTPHPILTFVASSTLVSYCTNLTSSPFSPTISPTRTDRQSLPANFGSACLVGGLLRRSCRACCESDGWRDARGDTGMPRMFSTKLERWLPPECGGGGVDMDMFSGLDMLSGAGGERGDALDMVWRGVDVGVDVDVDVDVEVSFFALEGGLDPRSAIVVEVEV